MDPRRLLIVDDHASFASMLGDILHDHGAEVSVALSGPEALALMQTHAFDALITDLQLPGMNGVELIREARRWSPGLPAVLISGVSLQAQEDAMQNLDVLAVLPKPVPFRRLLALLDGLQRPLH